MGGGVPYGCYVDPNSKNLEYDEKEQHIMRRARALHKEGATLADISKTLANEGLHARNGMVFKAMQIARMLEAK